MRARLLLWAAFALGAFSASLRAEEQPAAATRIAWFRDLGAARAVAAEVGRPVLVAIHRRPAATSPRSAMRFAAWLSVYREARVIAGSRAFACAMRLLPAPPGEDPDDPASPGVTHLVLDADGQVLLRADGTTPPSADGFLAFLRRGRAAFGAVPAGAPEIGRERVPGGDLRVEGISPMSPVSLPLGVPGLRVRLRWTMPTPRLTGDARTRIRARVLMHWDGVGPLDLGTLEAAPGETIDHPVDVRFADHDVLAPHLTEGTHYLDLALAPLPDSYPFSRGPLPVVRLWIDLGEGGGGGGGGDGEQENEQPPPPPPPEQPAQAPDGPEEMPEPPPVTRTEVVEPFVREGETIEKDDAVVAVEDPDAAVKPPRRVPLEEALREFEKVKERAIGEQRLAPRDRTLLERYFDALRDGLLGRKGPGK